MNPKRLFLYTLIGSVALCALIGILVILFGAFGKFETKVLLTTLTVAVTSILGLACGALYESRKSRLLPFTGIGAAVVSGILFIFIIWKTNGYGDIFVKVTLTATLIAASCSHLSLISLASLDRRFNWSRQIVFAAVGLLDAILLWLLWFEPSGDSQTVSRIIGVLSIIIASLTVVTPIFHKLSHNETGDAEIDLKIANLKGEIEKLEAQKANLIGL